jgi:uncharacterized damage-inducible protein DinB
MHRNGVGWSAFLSRSPTQTSSSRRSIQPTASPSRDRRHADGPTLDHGTDHRSQICTALTTLGIRPPQIGVMPYGIRIGTVQETEGTS